MSDENTTPSADGADSERRPDTRRRRVINGALTGVALAFLAVLPLGIAFGNSLLQELGFVLVFAALGCQALLHRTSAHAPTRPPFHPIADAELSSFETDRAIEYAAIKRRWLRLRNRNGPPG